MSSVLHPVGPEQPRTYWGRRIGIVAAALLIVIVLAWAMWPRAKTATPATSPSVSLPLPTAPTTSGGTPTGSTIGTPGASGSPSASSSSSSSASPSGPSPITDCNVQELTATVDGPGTIHANAKVRFAITVTNTG